MRVGIDLGTTYSAVARYNAKTSRTDIIRNKYEKDLTPSVICFMDDGSVLIGDDAKDVQRGGGGCIASVFKVSMGTHAACAELNGRTYTAKELSRMMLKELVRQAEEKTGEKVESAVITVPAYFDDLQRSSTRAAAESAGVTVTKIINEPTAAAIYYGYKHSEGKNILVYDLGGGTFDVTIVNISNGTIDVRGTRGNHNLGGKDWDETLLDFISERFYDEFGEDPRTDIRKRYELLADCEDYKKSLVNYGRATAHVAFGDNVGRYELTVEDFESATNYLIDAINDVLDDVFESSGMRPEQIDEVLLCGGSTRLPQVQRHLQKYGFKTIVTHRDTDLAVAKGAAIVASLYSSDDNRIRDINISDVNAHSLGILSIDPNTGRYRNEIMIPCNSKIPVSITKPFRLEEGNLTDQVEVFMLQGESPMPVDCTVIKHEVITGFMNNGKGAVIDITYSYNEDGAVTVTAARGGTELSVIEEAVPEDNSWIAAGPAARCGNKRVAKSIAICVDLSRSMETYLPEVKKAITDFVMSLSGEFTRFTLIGFGDKVKMLSPPSTDEEDILNAVEAMKINRLGRGTDANPLRMVREKLADEKGAKMALILTDGIWGHRDEAVEDAADCKQEMINIVAIGFGDADRSFLKQIATIEEGAMYTTLSNLGKTINTIATAIIDSPTGLVEHFR